MKTGTLISASFALVALWSSGSAATATAEEAAKLGNEFTPVGAIAAGNADGSLPEWTGDKNFTEEQKAYTYAFLEGERKKDPKVVDKLLRDAIKPEWQKIRFTITHANLAEHEDRLTVGHKAMFAKYSDYKMNVYESVRTAFFPQEIYDATKANATNAKLVGTDSVQGAKLGFPFPIPKQGAEVIWNHKLKFRGSAATRYNNQAIVKADGSYKISKLTEDVKFKYANLRDQSEESNKLIALYLMQVIEPPRVAGQLTLVHETADQGTSGRAAWLFNPGLGRVNRAPNVGYDNPSVGSDGEQFNDQVDVFNGALDRYDWTLVGKKEMYIPYNSLEMNSPVHKYDDIIQAGHINQNLARYELHRVWVVDANLRDGLRHQLKRRTFYVDEDSWSIAAVDGYDNRDQLWKLQEAHLVTAPFVPTTTGSPEIIYDLQSNRYFVTAMANEDAITDFSASFDDKYFTPAAMKRKARK